ncbi:hypothetical protein F5888DRAFT_1807154 [Russula emetica]|nr:hypothetical protein F5888DRAFT_1807154 [Russula emetica]
MLSLLLPTIVALYFFSSTAVRGSPCVAFDVTWNLLAFGLDGKDWNAGTQDTWANGTAADITASGRPPFDGTNTTCFLSQFTNAIYVTNGDKSSPSTIHIYDATAKSWSKQSVTTGSFDPSSFNAILDHDTNEFYALSNGELFRLDMGLLKAANSSALEWVDVEKAPYSSDYEPVMALAQNHVFFLNVPGAPAGSVAIYVIHYNYFQPGSQAFPSSKGTIPATHGQTASFFQTEGVQEEFAFIPDDCSATYVLNVESNTTQTLAGPSTKDAGASYFASINSLVQLDTNGGVSYFPYSQNDSSANAAAKWSNVASLANAAPPTNGTSTGTSTSSFVNPSQTLRAQTSSKSANGAVAVVAPANLLCSLSISRHPSQTPEDWDHPESMVDPSAVTSTTSPTPSRIVFPSSQGGATAPDPDAPTPPDALHRGGRAAGKRTLSELLKLHAEKGTDVHFTSEEANRLEDLLGQWINSSSSPYEGEDDFFTRSHDDSIVLVHRSSTFHSIAGHPPRGQSESIALGS